MIEIIGDLQCDNHLVTSSAQLFYPSALRERKVIQELLTTYIKKGLYPAERGLVNGRSIQLLWK